MDEKTLAEEIIQFFYRPPIPLKGEGWFTATDVSRLMHRSFFTAKRECEERYAKGELDRLAIGERTWYRIKRNV